MSEWNAERIARWRAGAQTEFPAVHVRRDDFLALLDELESYHDAFDDVMGALSQALDGDDMYNERPAEVVWRLRDQRDEALKAAKHAAMLAELEASEDLERSELMAQLTDYAEGLESTRAALAEAVTTIHDLRAGRLK